MPNYAPRPNNNGGNQQYPDREPLVRWGGLYTFKSGKGFAGNINVARVNPDTGVSFGQTLIDQIQQCLDEGRPLRIVVFENNFPDARSPYTINSTLGVSKEQAGERQDGAYPANDQGGSEPVPRPMRRGAPRR